MKHILLYDTDVERKKYRIRDYVEPQLVYAKDTGVITVSSEYDTVDLGLPSGNLWATKNLGASSPELEGGKFAWGETAAKTTFTEENYAFQKIDHNGSMVYSKYSPADGKSTLELEDDAAYAALGGNWRVPSTENWNELISNTTWSRYNYSSSGGADYIEFVSKINNKRLIIPFLPILWINKVSSSYIGNAYNVQIASAEFTGTKYLDLDDDRNRYTYGSIRPVLLKTV